MVSLYSHFNFTSWYVSCHSDKVTLQTQRDYVRTHVKICHTMPTPTRTLPAFTLTEIYLPVESSGNNQGLCCWSWLQSRCWSFAYEPVPPCFHSMLTRQTATEKIWGPCRRLSRLDSFAPGIASELAARTERTRKEVTSVRAARDI